MGEIKTTYEIACARYTGAMLEIMEKLLKGKSKMRGTHAMNMEWFFSWGTTIEGESISVQDLLSGKPRKQKVKPATLEDRVVDEIRRTHPSLKGKAGRWTGYAKLSEVPHEIVDIIQQAHERNMAEDARIAKLTPAERAAETTELLRKLSGMGGLAVFQARPADES